MNIMQAGVVAFHQAGDQPVGTYARPLPTDRIPVRVELLREEFIDELLPALGAAISDDGEITLTGAEQDYIEVADACIDIIYVTLGLLVEMGIDAQVLFDEVQRSNMSKPDPATGKMIIAGPDDPDGIFEGRVKKGPNYFRPNLRSLLLSGVADLEVNDPTSDRYS